MLLLWSLIGPSFLIFTLIKEKLKEQFFVITIIKITECILNYIVKGNKNILKETRLFWLIISL